MSPASVPYKDTFGPFLNQKLQARGMSPEELAKKAGLNRSTVYFYLQDRTRPTMASLHAICDAIDIPVEWATEHFKRIPNGRKKRVTPAATPS